MVFGIKLLIFSDHASFASHDSLAVDVSVVGHLSCGAVEIKHLAVYEVEACSFYLYFAG